MLKESHGNMYDWVTHMHSHLGGECPHKCSYCYVQKNPHGVSPRYKGNCRLVEEEFKIDYGTEKIIFIEHMNDMFADEIRKEWIDRILYHCNKYPINHYVFQTKNPERAWDFHMLFPKFILMGTTIETNRDLGKFSKAPTPKERYEWMKVFAEGGFETFITIEPIMDFDMEILAQWIIDIKPAFVNIGADSKRNFLPEPSPKKIRDLVNKLNEAKVPIKKKINLTRLLTPQLFHW